MGRRYLKTKFSAVMHMPSSELWTSKLLISKEMPFKSQVCGAESPHFHMLIHWPRNFSLLKCSPMNMAKAGMVFAELSIAFEESPKAKFCFKFKANENNHSFICCLGNTLIWFSPSSTLKTRTFF